MKTIWLQILVVIFFLIGAFTVTHLTENGLAIFAGGSLGICALLGWILTFKNKAVKFRHDFPWNFLGYLQPIPSKWFKPLEISFPEITIVLLLSMLFGAVIRIFWITNV